MPKTTPNAAPSFRISIEPQRALLTPSASPSVGPPDRPPAKRARFRSTPSSSVSATPSASNESTSSTDVNSARRASTLRVLNVWAQLEERYNKRLDEDDIVDLHSCAIIADRGVLKGAARDYHFGHFSQTDGDQDFPDAEQDQEDSEQDDDEDDELNTLPPSEASTYDDPPISKKDLLRGVPPLSATTDADDLAEFLEAEKRRRELAGDEDDEDDEDEMSPEELAVLREAMEEERRKNEAAIADHVEAVLAAHAPQENEADATPRRASTPPQESDPESEDELAVWTHDESTAVYAVAQAESEEDVSDKEFESILTRPPTRRPRSPIVTRKPQVVITQKKNRSVSKETSAKPPDDRALEVVGRPTPVKKGKGKERGLEEDDREAAAKPKPSELPSRGKKRKRVPSSSITDDQVPHPPAEPKNVTLDHADSSSVILPQSDSPKLTSSKDLTTSARFESAVAGPSRLSSSITSASKPQRHTLPSPEYTPLSSEPIPPSSHEYDYNTAPLSSSPLPPPLLHHARHPSHPPPIYPPHPATPGPSLPGHPPPPFDPVQTQQAHYLLAQAMHQLSYLMSAMPPYAAYASPAQPWQASPHPVYSTPPHPSHLHGSRAYHAASSSLSHPVLPPSSPSVSPPVEEPRARSRGRSKSRGRRVSFQLDSEETTRGPQHTIHPELYEQNTHKQVQDAKQVKGKGKMLEPSGNSLRLEDDSSDVPLREVHRGRTPGPPNRDKIHPSRGRSLSRR